MSNNFIEIRMEGGSLNLEILKGGGAQAVLEIQVEGGGGVKNPCLPSSESSFETNYMI